MTEKELIQKLQNGDVKAYEYLFDNYYNWLCTYIFNLSRNKALSKDIVQEIMIRFWEKRSSIMVVGSVKAYLFKSCHNHFLNYVKKEKRKHDVLDEIRWEALFECYLEEEEDLYEINLKKLHILIAKLPPKCKEIFIKSKLEKQKYKDIAIELGISIKTVENQMSKALHFLKQNASAFLF